MRLPASTAENELARAIGAGRPESGPAPMAKPRGGASSGAGCAVVVPLYDRGRASVRRGPLPSGGPSEPRGKGSHAAARTGRGPVATDDDTGGPPFFIFHVLANILHSV